VGAALFIYEALAESRVPPPPGRLVDIGGYRLHVDCTGSGTPTVILEAGLGDFGLSWSEVQPALAKSTRVCSYDRAGLGWSDAGPSPRDPTRETDELHTLLSRADIAPPYLVVGHSYGGDLSRLFVRRFPQGVAGLVLVEASNADQWSTVPEAHADWSGYLDECRLDPLRARFGLLRLKHQPIPYYADAVRPIAESFSYAPRAVMATCGEAAAILGPGPAELQPVRSFGDLPLIVISAGKNFWGKPESWAAWQAMQVGDSTMSTRSERVIADGSQHEVEHDRPDVVIAQVEGMLNVLRGFH
jgi:pimeloyl-ACP methyl ester carboxylesterase